MCARNALIPLPGYMGSDVSFVAFPWRGWIFRALPVPVAGKKIYFLIRVGAVSYTHLPLPTNREV